MRRKIVAGNWKMNTSLEQGLSLASEVINIANDELDTRAQLILAPPFTYLYPISKLVNDKKSIQLAAQNCSHEEKGAFTGEVSASMLQSMSIKNVIIGHSERRSIFGENNQLIKQKIEVAIKNKLHVIFCCGESENERKKNTHIDFVMNQLEQSIFHLSKENFNQISIAYEPVWAIGTGLNATPDQAQEMHASIRKNIEKKYTREIADSTSILYGGSCKPSNAGDLFKCPDIDGGLIGGSSLVARDFISIAKAISF